MAAPNYMKGRKGIKVPVHSVMDVIKTLQDLGHGDKFRQAAADQGAYVTLHPQTVNFVKNYMADNNLHEQNAVASDVVNGCPGGDPNQCPFQQP
jgi:hypothetical protein